MPGDTMTAAPGAAPSTLTLDTASQAKSLDDLAGLAANMEAPAGAPPGAGGATSQGAPVPQNPLALANATVLANCAQAMRDGFCQFTQLKAPKAIATDAVIGDLAKGWGVWCAARGIDLSAYMGKHADTIPLALSTAALAFAVYEATKAEISARKPVDAQAKPAGEGGAEGAAVQ